jgi:hypothetical protein
MEDGRGAVLDVTLGFHDVFQNEPPELLNA